jgi:simple sugar transport system substrate-binding protein
MKKMHRRNVLMLIAVVASFLAVAYTATASNSSAKKAQAVKASNIFYTVNNGCASDPFWTAVNNGAQAAGKTLHVTVRIAHPQNCESQAEENALLTTVINSHPAGIALSVTSATAFSANIQRAVKAGIPIVGYNSQPPNNDFTKNPYQAFVGTDLYGSGQAWGIEAMKFSHLKRGDLISLPDVCAANIACDSIVRGVKSKLGPAGVKVSVINVPQTVSESAAVMRAFLIQHPDTKAILSMGNPQSFADAMKALGKKPGQIPMSSYNLNGTMPQLMHDGWLEFIVNQVPYLQGFDAVVDLYTAAKDKQPPVNIQTGPAIIHRNQTALLDPALVARTGY